jgi:peroxiredoxin Q/BCP
MSDKELKVGDEAPDFSMMGSDGKTYSLGELKGKAVVLAWFPKAFTGGCTVQCNSLRASGQLIRQFDAAYFMASTDTPEENKGFAEKEHADFPILSDPGKQVATAYGVVTPERQLPMRHTFYIGPDGKILFIDKAVKPAGAAETTAAKLEELGIKKA